MIEPLLAIQRLAAGAQFASTNNNGGVGGGNEPIQSPVFNHGKSWGAGG